jgi:hypothetical protein
MVDTRWGGSCTAVPLRDEHYNGHPHMTMTGFETAATRHA